MANERVVVELIVDAKGAAAAIAQFNTAMDGANAKAEKIRETSTRMLIGVPQSVDRVATSLNKLQASLDPITKAQFQMEREMQRSMNLIERAVRTGVTTEQQAANTIAAIRQKQIRDLDALRDAHMRTVRASAANQNQGGGVSRFGALNASAQFQDIAVTAAMGQSPLTIALQQGTQLSAAFGTSGAAGAVKQLGAALSMMLNPLSLVTIGLVGAAALAIQYFMKWSSESDDSAEALKEQAELINRVADQWKGVLPSLSAYNTELEKTKDIQDAIAAGAAAASQQFAPARQQVPELSVDITDAVILLNQMADQEGLLRVIELQAAFATLAEKVKNSTASGEDALAVSQQLTDLLATYGVMAIGDYAGKFEQLATQLDEAAEKARAFREEAALLANQANMGLLDPLNGFNRSPFQSEEDIMFDRSRRAREDEEAIRRGGLVPQPTDRPNDIEMWDERTEAAEKAAKAAEENAKAIERERKAAESARRPLEDLLRTQRDRLDILQLEIGLMGQSEQVRATMISQLQTEQQIRKLGIDQNSAEAAAIRDNAAAITQYTSELADLQKAQEDLNERAQFFGDLTVGVFDDLTSGADGFEKAVKRIVNALADAVIQAVLLGQGPLASLFGTSPTGGASVGGLFGGLFGGGVAGGGGAGGAAAFGTAGGLMTMLQTAGGYGKVPDNVGAGAGAGNASAGGGEIAEYIRQAAIREGIDPNVAIRVAKTEGGLTNPFQQSYVQQGYGREESFGPFQLHMRGGVGSRALEAGIDPRTNWKGGVDFALKEASQKGWGQWFGAAKAGIGDREGIGVTAKLEQNISKLSDTTAMAAKDVGSLGNAGASATQGLGQLGNALAQFPSAPGAFGGGAFGAGGGGLASLFGGGGGPSFTPFELDYVSTHAGLFARGGVFSGGNVIPFARGGVVSQPMLFPMAQGAGLMGEAGPEAVMPLRRGANGSLGVAMHGGGAQVVVNNTVVNQAGVDVDQKSTNRPDGGVDIVTTIKRIVADDASRPGTPMDKALTARNARPALKRYG